MKSQITTAFDDHSEHLDLVIRSIVSKFEPNLIFSFSKNISIGRTEGSFKQQQFSFEANYCLLVATKDRERIDHEIQEFVDHIYKQGDILVVGHGIDHIYEEIAINNNFFISVFTSGELLYSENGKNHQWHVLQGDKTYIPLAANKFFKRHISYAEAFLSSADICRMTQQYNICVFNLHQVVEQCCIGLMQVFLSYRAEFHNINRLLRLCTSFSDIPLKSFFAENERELHLFKTLVKGYSQTRYGKDYVIDETDANGIYAMVSKFFNLTKKMCTEKVAELKELHGKSSDVKA